MRRMGVAIAVTALIAFVPASLLAYLKLGVQVAGRTVAAHAAIACAAPRDPTVSQHGV